MSLEFMDGFDHYSTGNMPQKGWVGGGGGMATGRFGGQAWNTFNNATSSYLLPAGSLATRIVGIAFNPGNTPGNISSLNNLITLFDTTANTAGTQLQFRIVTGFIQVVRGVSGSGGTVLATASTGPTLKNNTWYYLEIKATIGASGSVQVNISDGVASTTIINISGVNTQNTANATFNGIWLNGDYLSGFATQYDDLYVCTTAGAVNNTFLGESRVTPIWMSSNGHSTQWTPLTSTNVSQINETLVDDDTSYNLSSTVGQIDAFVPRNLGTTTPILAVQTNLTARKDDVGARSIAADVYDGTTDHINANSHGLLSSYTDFLDVYETDPSTSAQWTQSGFNARQFGYKMIS